MPHHSVMDLTGYVETLRNELGVAAATGGDEALELAERLTGPLDAAARLVLQEALSDAAQEITRDLAPGSVELRLRGRALEFVVTPPPALGPVEQEPAYQPPFQAREADTSGEGGTSRISFRPPEELKARIEDAAEREGLSVNAFLVRTLSSALDPGRRSPSSRPDTRDGERVRGWFR